MNVRSLAFLTVAALVLLCLNLVPLRGIANAQGGENLLIYDDFSTDQLDPQIWQFVSNSAGATFSISNGVAQIFGGFTDGGGGMIQSVDMFSADGNVLVLETRGRVDSPDGGGWYFYSPAGKIGFAHSPTGLVAFTNVPGVWHTIDLPEIDSTEWHTYSTELRGTEARFYVDGIYVATITEDLYQGPMHVMLERGSSGNVPILYTDYVRLSIFSNQSPSVNAGGPYTVNEGGSVTVLASGSDPEGEPLNYAWDLDNDGSFETSGQSVAFSAAELEAPSVYTITVRATDSGGLTATDQTTVTVTYIFTGFFQPIDNLPVLNMINAGRSIPVKFSLSGDQGLNIFDAGYPKSEQVPCDSTAPVDGIEETVTAGSSSLTYDPSTDQYKYVWQTDQAWTNTCRQLVLKLNDGTYHRANFKFR